MAGVLDSARFQLFIARELGVSVKDVRPMVLGGHATRWCPCERLHRQRRPRAAAHRADKLAAIVDRTRNGGGEIRQAHGHERLLCARLGGRDDGRSYLKDLKRMSRAPPTSKAEYGYSDLYMACPWSSARAASRRS